MSLHGCRSRASRARKRSPLPARLPKERVGGLTRFTRRSRHPPLFKGRARHRAKTPSVVHRSFEQSSKCNLVIPLAGKDVRGSHTRFASIRYLTNASNVFAKPVVASPPRPHDPFESPGGWTASTSWRRMQPTFFSFQRRSSPFRAAIDSRGDRNPSAPRSSVSFTAKRPASADHLRSRVLSTHICFAWPNL